MKKPKTLLEILNIIQDDYRNEENRVKVFNAGFCFFLIEGQLTDENITDDEKDTFLQFMWEWARLNGEELYGVGEIRVPFRKHMGYIWHENDWTSREQWLADSIKIIKASRL